VALFDLEDFSYKEITEILQAPLGTVKLKNQVTTDNREKTKNPAC